MSTEPQPSDYSKKPAAPVSKRVRKIVVGSLLAGHVLSHVILSLIGAIEPLEFFNLLLLAANFVIAVLLVRKDRDLLLGAGIMFLVAAHAFIGQRLAPDALTSGAILFVNILILYVGTKINVHFPARYWYAFVAGYFLLFYIFIIQLDNAEALFLLFLLGLAATARSFRLAAYFWALTLSFTFCQPYAWEAAIISFIILFALFGSRGNLRSRTALVFLCVGLIVVFLVLLPVIITVLGEDPHNLINVLRDSRIRSAIWITVLTATISTIFLVIFIMPLAYAISRLRFPGRTLLLSLIDIPIVIPQSVAGIALIKVFGKQQFIGDMFFRAFGLRFDGTMLGICVAQVFVSMPFIARSAIAAFDAVPEELELSARTLGASSWSAFRRVSLPLASRGLFLGAVLAWARAAGEFGAVIFIAPTPETAPIAAFNRFNSVGVVEAAPLVAVLLLFSLAMFFLLQFVSRSFHTVHGRKGERP